MNVNALGNVPVYSSGVSSTGSKKTASGVMGKDDFLKLFLAGLQYQDPFSPMESSDMMQQMAMLTMVEQITNLSEVVENLKEIATVNPIEKGMQFLGKKVEGMASDGSLVEGVVQEVKINRGKLELMVGEKELGLENIIKVMEQYKEYAE